MFLSVIWLRAGVSSIFQRWIYGEGGVGGGGGEQDWKGGKM